MPEVPAHLTQMFLALVAALAALFEIGRAHV